MCQYYAAMPTVLAPTTATTRPLSTTANGTGTNNCNNKTIINHYQRYWHQLLQQQDHYQPLPTVLAPTTATTRPLSTTTNGTGTNYCNNKTIINHYQRYWQQLLQQQDHYQPLPTVLAPTTATTRPLSTTTNGTGTNYCNNKTIINHYQRYWHQLLQQQDHYQPLPTVLAPTTATTRPLSTTTNGTDTNYCNNKTIINHCQRYWHQLLQQQDHYQPLPKADNVYK